MKLSHFYLAGSALSVLPSPTRAQRSVADADAASTWWGFIGTGQSLSVGVGGGFVAADPPQTFGNLKLTDSSGQYALNAPDASSLSAVPLQEPIRPAPTNGSGTYPGNIYGQTPHRAMADQMSVFAALAGSACTAVHSVVGETGRSITTIQKNGLEGEGTPSPSYAAALFEAQALRALARGGNRTYQVGGIVLTHGEADASLANYSAAVMNMVYDYQFDLTAITGQSSRIPLILSQQNTIGPGGDVQSPLNTTTFCWSRYAAFKMATNYPRDVVLAGPKYQYTYFFDGLHLIQAAYRRLGEKYGQVAYKTVIKGNGWLPTLPLFASLQNATRITVPYHAPVSPLQWDNATPAPHAPGSAWALWGAGRGFEVFNGDGTPVGIQAVNLLAGDVVQIDTTAPLSGVPRVQYAMTQDGKTGVPRGGSSTGAIGQLTDSDPFIGVDAEQHPCALTAGSAQIGCDDDVLAHDLGDEVFDASGQLLGRIASRVDNRTFTLTQSVAALSGTFNITFRYNQQNYAVASSQPVLFSPVVNATLPAQWARVGFGWDTGFQGICAAQVGKRWLNGAAGSDGICRIPSVNGNVFGTTSYQLLTSLTDNATWVNNTGGDVAVGALVAGVAKHRPLFACRVANGAAGYPVGSLRVEPAPRGGVCRYVQQGGVVESDTYQTLAMSDGL